MSHRRLPLAWLAVASAALVGPGGVGAQTTGAPPAGPAMSTRPIPAALLARLQAHIAAEGRDTSLPPAIASALGLGVAGQAWPNRQFAVRAQATGVVHAVAAGAGPDSDLILSSRGDAAITVFHIRRDGALVGAVYYFPETLTVAAVPAGAAAHDFDDERVFWIRTIDTLGADE